MISLMKKSETKSLLQKKVLKIFGFLLLIRLGLYIPLPNVDIEIFLQTQTTNSLFGLSRSLTGSSFLGIGSLGILPYINSSILIQFLTPLIPNLTRLQKDEGEIGRQQIIRYTRYLTLGWSLILSTGVAFTIVKPVIFNWNILLALKVIFSLTTGSMLSMWFAELITKENLGNGSSMIIFINIIGGLPANIREFSINLQNSSLLNNFFTVFSSYLVYLIIVGITVLVQESYMKIDIISARQLNYNYLEKSSAKDSKLNNSYIPIKLNQGGIMPLVFSTTIATFLLSPLQMILSKISIVERTQLTSLLTLSSFILNLFLIVFFSNFLSLLVLKPKDLSENLTKMAYSVPGIKPGKDTIQYLEKIISRLAFMGGIFLAFLAFFPVLVSNIFEFNLFKNITSLIIMVGVVTDVTSRVKGYLISQNYESLKEA